MIGSHDSFTYLTATNKAVELFSTFWRCQDKTIKQQYDAGVRCFDVRVCAGENNGKFTWVVCHGSAKFLQVFSNLSAILVYFKNQYPGAITRIVLESGDNTIVDKFKKQCETILKGKNKGIIWELIIKDNWEVIYRNPELVCHDHCCHLFNWDPTRGVWSNITHIDLSASSIKSYAKKNNPTITDEMIHDPNHIYIMDYVV